MTFFSVSCFMALASLLTSPFFASLFKMSANSVLRFYQEIITKTEPRQCSHKYAHYDTLYSCALTLQVFLFTKLFDLTF